jgi:hypothetical protein
VSLRGEACGTKTSSGQPLGKWNGD